MEITKKLSLKKGLVKVLTEKEVALVAGGHGVQVNAATNLCNTTNCLQTQACPGNNTLNCHSR